MIDRTEKEIMQRWKGDLTTPLVSICTITYNHENFIEEALDSFLMQKTDFPFEIVIDDDASPDHTADIIKKYVEKYPRIFNARLRDKNVGSMTNFIENMQRANGKYIALCEGDDYWTDPLKLQKQVDFLENNPKYSGCFHDSMIVNDETDDKQIRIGTRKIDEDVDLISLVIEKNIATASLLFINFTKEIQDFWKEIPQGDYILSVLIAERGLIKYLPEVMSAYRIHGGGVWSSQHQIYHTKEDLKFYNMLETYFKNDLSVQKAIKSKKKFTYYRVAVSYTREHKRLLSLYYVLLSISWNENKHKSIKYKKYFKEFIKSFIR